MFLICSLKLYCCILFRFTYVLFLIRFMSHIVFSLCFFLNISLFLSLLLFCLSLETQFALKCEMWGGRVITSILWELDKSDVWVFFRQTLMTLSEKINQKNKRIKAHSNFSLFFHVKKLTLRYCCMVSVEWIKMYNILSNTITTYLNWF